MSKLGKHKYLLDANVFIEAAKRYYAFDIAPSFWRELGCKAQEGMVLSIDRVNAEISSNNQKIGQRKFLDDLSLPTKMTLFKHILQ